MEIEVVDIRIARSWSHKARLGKEEPMITSSFIPPSVSIIASWTLCGVCSKHPHSTPSRLRLSVSSAVLALAFFFSLALPALAQLPDGITCDPLKRGTIDADSTGVTFTEDPSGTDLRIKCTGTAPTPGTGDYPTLSDEAIISVLEDGGYTGESDADEVLFELSNLRFSGGQEIDYGGNFVFTGNIQSIGDRATAFRLDVQREETRDDGIEIDSVADVETDGAASRGIYVRYLGDVEFFNHGDVRTTGDRLARPDGSASRSHAVEVRSIDGDAVAVNEVGARITTTGSEARGLVARAGDGNAEAINHGTVQTSGDGFSTSEAYGIYGYSEGGDATAVNEAGGQITTSGTGARGIYAKADGTAKTAAATNHGTVVTTGGAHISNTGSRRRAQGVRAYAESGMAMAVNSGSIRTEGDYATGLYPGGGSATARNEQGATITASGDGAQGIFVVATGVAVDNPKSVNASAVNAGTVTTSGGVYISDIQGYTSAHLAQGVYARSSTGSAEATNAAGGRIETGRNSTGATGLRARTSAAMGDATATNDGTVIVQGDAFLGENGRSTADAVRAQTVSGDATAINRNVIETTGAGARGLAAYVSDAGDALVRNEGTITTSGGLFEHDPSGTENDWRRSSSGMIAISAEGDASATNSEDGMITTRGVAASGIAVLADGASSNAEAINRGSVTVTGASVPIDEDGDGVTDWWARARGVAAQARGGGNASAENTGTVTVGSTHTSGLHAYASGDGNASVTMSSGMVNMNGDYTAGIWAGTETGTARVVLAGSDSGTTERPSVTATGPNAVGIHVEAAEGGLVDIETANVLIEAPVAVQVIGGRTAAGEQNRIVFTDNTTLRGNVEFGAGNDYVKVHTSTSIEGNMTFGAGDDHLFVLLPRIDGDISFGEGFDILTFDVPDDGIGIIKGDITGIEDFIGTCPGTKIVGNVTFSASSAEVNDGLLIINGKFDLGDGTLTVKDSGKLGFGIGDIATDPTAHGAVTAGSVEYAETAEPKVVFQLLDSLKGDDQSATRVEVQKALAARNLDSFIVEGTVTVPDNQPLTLVTGGVEPESQTEIGTVDPGTKTITYIEGFDNPGNDSVLIVQGVPPTEPTVPPTVRKGKGGGGEGAGVAVLGGALVALLLFGMLDDDDAVTWSPGSPSGSQGFVPVETPGFLDPSRYQVREGSVTWWRSQFGQGTTAARGLGADVQGLAVGMDADLGRGFSLGVAALPEGTVSGSAESGPMRLEGGQYAVRGLWRDEDRFVGLTLLHGSYSADSVFHHPVVGSHFAGSFKARYQSARFTAGTRLELGGVAATPALSMFSGTYRQSAYTAHDQVFAAEVPGVSQSYTGWRAAMGLTTQRAFDLGSGLQWQPTLKLGATRIHADGADTFAMRHADRVGALEFSTSARAGQMPQTVYGFGTGVNLRGSNEGWRLRVGYVGMIADGEPVHGVMVGFRVKF